MKIFGSIPQNSFVLGLFFVIAASFWKAPVFFRHQEYVASAAISQGFDEQRGALQEELDILAQQIESLRESLRDIRQQGRTLIREERQLDQEIQRTELSLERSASIIVSLQTQNDILTQQIAESERGIGKRRQAIGVLLRTIAETDDQSSVSIFLSSTTLASIADRIEASASIQKNLLSSIADVRNREASVAEQKHALEERQRTEEQAQQLLVIARDDLLVKRAIRSQLRQVTRGREEIFAQQISATQMNSARIQEQLYLLVDVGRVLSFGDAYRIAKPIADQVGIRPAFLLAVLQKESRLGALVGTGFWRTDMHPRDWSAFLHIAQELGIDPDTLPVSRKPAYGWGGAMGPAQFLPSTWRSYEDRIAAITKHTPPSPWNVADAFAAAALKLASGGATQKTVSAEWQAAMVYFAGGDWQNPAYAFYGDAIEDLAATFQEQIDIVEGGIPSQ